MTYEKPKFSRKRFHKEFLTEQLLNNGLISYTAINSQYAYNIDCF